MNIVIFVQNSGILEDGYLLRVDQVFVADLFKRREPV